MKLLNHCKAKVNYTLYLYSVSLDFGLCSSDELGHDRGRLLHHSPALPHLLLDNGLILCHIWIGYW